ncbi:MAG: response regulator transcription factor [Eubacteriales bacterium]|nr:response regulator transcription factor [Eubacteriales bacterium]
MIFTVEDDQSIRELVIYALEQSGYEVKGFPEGESFQQALETQIPDLVLLDQMLPGVDGETLLKNIRANPKTKQLPVIMVTAKGEEMDKVRALDHGADDYIVKPFGVMELLSRIKAVLRRTEPKQKSGKFSYAGIDMDVERHFVSSNGETLNLTNKEFDLLRCMLTTPEIVFTREKLLDTVWDIAYYGDTRTVDAHIRSLRQKLGDNAYLIETVRGVGYKIGSAGKEKDL